MIKSIRIAGFRSFKDVSIDGLGDFVAIVGRNGVGKSNVLRALNLFFNGQVEPGQSLSLARDFHRSGQSKAKQLVRIEVGFALPGSFNFRKGVKAQASALGLTGGKFTIAREWQLDPVTESVVDEVSLGVGSGGISPVSAGDRRVLELLLTRLIRYRYIPNHVHPVDLIRSEQEHLQQELIAKINRSKSLKEAVDTDAPLQAMTTIARSLIEPVADEVGSAAPELSDVTLATPSSWADIAMTLDLEVRASGDVKRGALVHGSGHQSVLALALIHLLDTSFSTKFGWHQATIWGLEEPESFLHQELAYQTAGLLRTYAEDGRFQVLTTTHSPVLMAHSNVGVLVTRSGDPSIHTPQEVIELSATEGASAFVHPLLQGAPKPLLVVEGDTDVRHLELAYEVLRRPNPWEIRSLDYFGLTGGVNGFNQLIKYHSSPIGARPAKSPLVLLLDHDQSGKVGALRAAIQGIHASSSAVAWDPSIANPDLDLTAFRGIEAFLSTEALEAGDSEGALTLLKPHSGVPISVDKSKVNKAALCSVMLARKEVADFRHFIGMLTYIESQLSPSPMLHP